MEDNISSDCEIKNHTNVDYYDFSTLPPHISVLTNILSHLPIEDFKYAAESCKPWYYASCDPRISKQIALRFSSEPTDCENVFLRPVTKLRFEYLNLEKFDYKRLLRNLGDKITQLDINSCSCQRITQLFEMFIYLPNLKVLRLEYGNRYFNPNIFDKFRKITKHKARIMRNLGRLQELHINTNEKNLKGAEILLSYCTNLKSLHWNEYFSEDTPDYFLHNVLVNRNNNCTSESLETLVVHSIDRKQNSKFFEHLINLNRTNLRSLDLKEISESYYDVMFKEFCKTYSSLEHLTMSGCNDQQLVDICKYMRNLKTLSVDDVSATNFNSIGWLNNLTTLRLNRIAAPTDDSLIEFLRLKPKNLLDATFKIINSALLKEICENLPQLKRLRLEWIETKECEPIFRNLTKLEALHLEFVEYSQIHSTLIESDPEWNVTKLVELKDVYVSTFLPGFTPDLIKKLPKLKSIHHEYVYDPEPQTETEEEENEEENNEQDGNENNEDEEVQDDEAIEQEEQNEEVPKEEEDNENRVYDPMEFELYSTWFCDSDAKTNQTVITRSSSRLFSTIYLIYVKKLYSLIWRLRNILTFKSRIPDTLNWSRLRKIWGNGEKQDENREYDPMEFKLFPMWFCVTE